ncbi:MAG: AbrB/MazE/SpoVT family DNA-binding domain-containing protein [Chloroflexi bacterium]|nr:AbrB/MazE/SpoVT family DNA-binding domain-containing protein [Chloroflexota bacterium]
MSTATVSAKGWVVIPQEIRQKYGLKKGRKVRFIDLGGVVSIVPVPDDPIAAGLGMFKGGPSLTQGLLEDRRQELEWEERGLPPPRPEP